MCSEPRSLLNSLSEINKISKRSLKSTFDLVLGPSPSKQAVVIQVASHLHLFHVVCLVFI